MVFGSWRESLLVQIENFYFIYNIYIYSFPGLFSLFNYYIFLFGWGDIPRNSCGGHSLRSSSLLFCHVSHRDAAQAFSQCIHLLSYFSVSKIDFIFWAKEHVSTLENSTNRARDIITKAHIKNIKSLCQCMFSHSGRKRIT